MKAKMRNLGMLALVLLWAALTLALWFGPRTDVSAAERRKLEQFPKMTADTLLSGRFMTKFEAFAQDQFPLRDSFRQLKALFSYDLLNKKDNNGIYRAEGHLAKLEYPLNQASVESAVKKFERIRDLYLTDATRVVISAAPDKGYYLAERNGYPAMDYEELFDILKQIPWAQYADITAQLEADCYYRTDTHWRQEKLMPAARVLAQALEVTVEEEYRQVAIDRPFYGVYYGQAALPVEPETLYVLRSDLLDACTATNYETNGQGSVYDLTKLNSRDLYDVFLSGSVSILTVENPMAQTDRELIVFRDSFGSSMVPLLMKDYAKVTLLDLRYVPTDYLDRFVTFADQDILFLYSPLVLNNSAMLK